jgi:heme-degrading monooxygenase HmoA
MTGLYTSGDWYAKEGSADAFIDAWMDLAEWTISSVPGCTFVKLLRDQEDPSHFLSFSPWRDESAVAAWRELPGFVERVDRLQGLLREFTPRTMRIVAEAGPATPDPW